MAVDSAANSATNRARNNVADSSLLNNTSEPQIVDGSLADALDTIPGVEAIEIRPVKGWASLGLSEAWNFRELLAFFLWRDVKVRYKQTVLGIGWAVVQPVTSMIVFSIFFGELANISSEGTPYPIFSYAALLPWTLFANGYAAAAVSMVNQGHIIRKVYFPRVLVPISSLMVGVVDFVFAFMVLVVLMFIYRVNVTANMLLLPIFLLITLITSSGLGLWFASLNVQFRDVRYLIPFFTQVMMFATPIVYPSSLIENETLRTLYSINPMVGVIEGFRWALLGIGSPPGIMTIISATVAVILLITGAYYFRRVERTFADVI
jgi:lipopolysaccharide transport system permease protein